MSMRQGPSTKRKKKYIPKHVRNPYDQYFFIKTCKDTLQRLEISALMNFRSGECSLEDVVLIRTHIYGAIFILFRRGEQLDRRDAAEWCADLDHVASMLTVAIHRADRQRLKVVAFTEEELKILEPKVSDALQFLGECMGLGGLVTAMDLMACAEWLFEIADTRLTKPLVPFLEKKTVENKYQSLMKRFTNGELLKSIHTTARKLKKEVEIPNDQKK